jgi:hypothetical protein
MNYCIRYTNEYERDAIIKVLCDIGFKRGIWGGDISKHNVIFISGDCYFE